MRELILKMSISLDGFVAGPNGEADWIFRNRGADSTAWTVETLWQAGAHAWGRRSFDDVAGFYPYSDLPFAPPMNEIPKIVFSRRGLTSGAPAASAAPRQVTPTEEVLRSWAKPAVAIGDLAAEVARLKAESGGFILAHGGATFAQNLVATGLVDEYRLLVSPIALGRGLPLFSALPQPLPLRLVSRVSFVSGAVGEVYRPT